MFFSFLMVFIAGSAQTVTGLSPKTWLFLIISGLATGDLWLCYFRALQLGDVNKVVPIDKSSTVLTILLTLIFLGEPITFLKAIATVLIGVGTVLMVEKKGISEETDKKKKLADLCRALGGFCRSYFNSRKNRYQRRGIKPRYCDTHLSCTYYGVAHSSYKRKIKRS